jgi:hypothetical protein
LPDTPENDRGIYVVTTNGNVIKVAQNVGTRISLLDNCTWGYFVNSENGVLHSIEFNQITNAEERVFVRGFLAERQWRNVAVSKDGKRLALVSRELNNLMLLQIPANRLNSITRPSHKASMAVPPCMLMYLNGI